MGRAKLPTKLIRDERSRNTTFTKRRRGLAKKMFEFSTLCDVEACMIVYSSAPGSCPQTWPEDPAEVRRVIERFQQAPKEERGKRQQDMSSLLRSKIKKLQDELEHRRKENAKLASLLLWNRSSLEDMDLNEVLDLQQQLDSKIGQVNGSMKSLEEHSFSHDLGESPKVPGSTSPHFQCLGGAERLDVARYETPLQSALLPPPALPAATITMPEWEEVLVHLGYDNNIGHYNAPCGGGGGSSDCWLSDYEAALNTGATPAYYCTQPTPCMQTPAAFGWGMQESNAFFMAEETFTTNIDDQKTTKYQQQLVSQAPPYSLPPLPLMQEDMDLFVGLLDQLDPMQAFDDLMD
ncbi:Agamous-like MADS-box protein [Nymphaea thermarum]|nr:Agamous-like MADS-box protein [Nymphaea thermarum]